MKQFGSSRVTQFLVAIYVQYGNAGDNSFVTGLDGVCFSAHSYCICNLHFVSVTPSVHLVYVL